MCLSQIKISEKLMEVANFYDVLSNLMLLQMLRFRQQASQMMLFRKVRQETHIFGWAKSSLETPSSISITHQGFSKAESLSALYGASKVMNTLPFNVASERSIINQH